MSLFIDALANLIRGSIGDAEATRADWEKALSQVYGTPEPRQLEPSQATLIYTDEAGTTYEQPVADLTSVGTLIDPEGGEDLDLIAVRLAPADDETTPVGYRGVDREGRVWNNELPHAIANCLADREEPETEQIIAWLHANEHDDVVWATINGFFDDLGRISGVTS